MAITSQPPFSTINDLDLYLVGGAVRDQYLQRPILERDWLVVGCTIAQMKALGFEQVGRDFPVFLHPKTKEEYALARTERKSGNGYTGFECFTSPEVTIEEDLLRRDLTINAMAINRDGKLIDPYNGLSDLNNKILRHVSPAFSEDPLRVLRVARFAARYAHLAFTIAPETMQLMTDMSVSGELNHLTAERVWKEFSRALLEPAPDVFITVLRECGALEVLWPDLAALWGVPNPLNHHPENCTGIHTLMVLQQAAKLSDSLAVRFAALCHDLGKGLTPETLYPSHRGHEKSGLPLVKAICEKFKVPNDITHLALLVCEYHLHCHRALELKASTLLKLFNALDIWRKPEMLTLFLLSCEADAKGRLGFEEREYPQGEYIKSAAAAALAVQAKTFVEKGLQGIAIKNALREARLAAIELVKQQTQ